jgi:hypothetical protein
VLPSCSADRAQPFAPRGENQPFLVSRRLAQRLKKLSEQARAVLWEDKRDVFSPEADDEILAHGWIPGSDPCRSEFSVRVAPWSAGTARGIPAAEFAKNANTDN